MTNVNGSQQRSPDAETIVRDLFRDFESNIGENLWAWEPARWHELVFCILLQVGEPEVPAATVRNLTNRLSEFGLLDLESLATLDLSHAGTNGLFITIRTLLEQAGFTSEKSRAATLSVHQAASALQTKFGGKVQNYFQKYGQLMLKNVEQDFGLTYLDNARNALAIWLQNVLNMPVPACGHIIQQACNDLGVTYDELVRAANRCDINIALLDDALRNHWQNRSSGEGGQ